MIGIYNPNRISPDLELVAFGEEREQLMLYVGLLATGPDVEDKLSNRTLHLVASEWYGDHDSIRIEEADKLFGVHNVRGIQNALTGAMRDRRMSIQDGIEDLALIDYVHEQLTIIDERGLLVGENIDSVNPNFGIIAQDLSDGVENFRMPSYAKTLMIAGELDARATQTEYTPDDVQGAKRHHRSLGTLSANQEYTPFVTILEPLSTSD